MDELVLLAREQMEKSVGTGYLLNTESYKAEVKPNQTTTQAIINNEPTGEISLIKTDKDTGNSNRIDGTSHHGDVNLKGTEYTLYAKEYERMIEILQAYREQYCKKCSATMVCNGVCICMSYMYVQDSQLLEYSCNQSRHIFENILDINDEVIEDIRTGNDEKYNEFARNIFMKDIDNYAKSISFKRNQIN